MDQEVTGRTDTRRMYFAGLSSGMLAYARGDGHMIERSHTSSSALVMAFDDGFDDTDDDSDEPRPAGPALDDPRGEVEPNDDEAL